MRTTFILSFALIATLSLGCGDSPQTDVATNGNSTSAATDDTDENFVPISPGKVYNDPRDSVRDFLMAITRGDDKTATSLLTYAAQRETWSNGLALTSEGLPGTNFTVGHAEQVKEDETHVETTYVDEQDNTYPCVWLLRKENEGWRIFAMATKFMEGAAPVILPFEDHAEMERRHKAAVQQLNAQHQRNQMASSTQNQAAAQASPIGTQQPVGRQNGQIQQASRSTELR